MPRSSLLLVAAALAAGTIGCAHCDTCDDFPTPCTGPNCGYAGLLPGAPEVMAPGPVSQPAQMAPPANTNAAPETAPAPTTTPGPLPEMNENIPSDSPPPAPNPEMAIPETAP
jgi:hypothetical protein